MKYRQTYNITEDLHGEQIINIIVSDIYSDLLSGGGSPVNILSLETIKQDLSLENDSYGIDELQFTIRETQCESLFDKQCLSFLLDAGGIHNNRLIAVYFGAVDSDNLRFIGKISSKIGGTDIYYVANLYETKEQVREYKFTALSIDLSLLKKISFNSKITKENGQQIDGLNDRISDVGLSNIFKHRRTIVEQGNYYYTNKLAKLTDVINYYFGIANTILNELGFGINIVLGYSELGFKAGSVWYELAENIFTINKYGIWSTFPDVELNPNSEFAIPFIDISLIRPDDINKELSFLAISDLAEFISKLAKTFVCFPQIMTTDGINYEVTFKPYKAVVNNQYTYIAGYTDGSINISNQAVNKANEYIGMANVYAADGHDIIKVNGNYIKEKSDKLIKQAENIRNKYKQQEVAIDRYLLTTSNTLEEIFTQTQNNYIYINKPLNIWNKSTDVESWDTSIYQTISYSDDGGLYYIPKNNYFNNAIYRRSTAPPNSNHLVVRPIMGILVKIDNEDMYFNTLSDYANYVYKRDKFYYQTEIELSVPFWNGFSNNVDGSNASWRFAKLGNKVKIGKTLKKYIGGQWEDVYLEKDYIITGVEINLNTPFTKIKLQNIDRFNFTHYTGSNPAITEEETQGGTITGNNVVLRTYTAGENIGKGNAVSILNNIAYKSKINVVNDESVMVGIATNDAITNSAVIVQISGVYAYPNSFNMEFTNTLIVRHNFEPNINVTNNIGAFPLTNEYYFRQLGKLLDDKRVIIKIEEYKFD